VWITTSLTSALTPTAIALGNFDGIHRGHRQVIQPVLDPAIKPERATDADELNGPGMLSTVVTFSPHPQEFFSGIPRNLLTPQPEKVLQLQGMGIEQLMLLPFDRELARLSPQEFVETILVGQLQAKHISVGQDFLFGHKRAGNAVDLQAIAASFGVAVTIVPLETYQGHRISSSAIRQALQAGDLPLAERMLGRAYTLMGQVVTGQQLGRTIGFPTANLQLPANKCLPREGVYGVRVSGPGIASPLPILGVMNIGNRPTVNGLTLTIEVHLLDWAGDLYGQMLTVELVQFIRPEQKFASIEDLKAQISADCAIARTMLSAPLLG
jgi:riboflavin kinase / FMN adenylyltransferase